MLADLSCSAGGLCRAKTAPSDTSAPCPAFVQASGWSRRLGSSDFGRSFRLYRMDTRWQHSPDHLWDVWLSICVQLAVLIKYSLPHHYSLNSKTPSPDPCGCPQIRNRGCRPHRSCPHPEMEGLLPAEAWQTLRGGCGLCGLLTVALTQAS